MKTGGSAALWSTEVGCKQLIVSKLVLCMYSAIIQLSEFISREHFVIAGVLLYSLAAPMFQQALQLASSLPSACLLLLLPFMWLAFGTGLCFGTILLKKLVMPMLASDRPLQLWSLDFARWWLVHRAIAVTNHLFARRLRGTAFLPAYMRALVSPTTRSVPRREPYFLGQGQTSKGWNVTSTHKLCACK